MSDEQFVVDLRCSTDSVGDVLIVARERVDLEFKRGFDSNTIKKCIKTVAAFANRNGGSIVFGISENPRRVVGCDVDQFPDEASLASKIAEWLYPAPDFRIVELDICGKRCVRLLIDSSDRKPVIANKDIQTSERGSKPVLSQGIIYFRRAGQSGPITGAELNALLERRDQRVRDEVMNFISHGRAIGFQNAVVADFRGSSSGDDNVTLLIPEKAAKDLNVIDRARLVSDGGAPAYEIRGGIRLTSPSDSDPRIPMLSGESVAEMQSEIQVVFGGDFKWSHRHLRMAATHLGFWSRKDGDSANVGRDSIHKTSIYYQAGRLAILDFARSSPDEFVDAVASKAFKEAWRRRARQLFDD